jgi:hypothetical protein
MNALAKHRMNSMYAHPTSVAHRAEEAKTGEPSPIGALRLKHHDEAQKLGRQITQETDAMHDEHQRRRNDDSFIRNGGRASDETKAKEAAQLKELSEHHSAAKADMARRHKMAMEDAIKKHGGAL